MTENTIAVEITGVSKRFDDVLAVDNVNLQIRTGEIFALLGGSGCGKTTLLRMLAGFEQPNQGDILINGESMLGRPPYQRPVNMMFQSYALFPHMTVQQNIAFGLKQDKLSSGEVKARTEEMLNLVQMPEFAHRKPSQLSGGQQQRIALARSLAKKPRLLLLDEPMGALDKKLRIQMQLELANIIESVGVTCVMVTHDQEEAMTMANRIAIMDKGSIQQVGPPREVYEFPNSKLTAEFIGTINLFPASIVEKTDKVRLTSPLLEDEVIASADTSHLDNTCYVGLRPEKIHLTTEVIPRKSNQASGVIDDIAYLGSHMVVHVRLANGHIVQVHVGNLARDAKHSLQFEQAVNISWDDSAVILIPQDTAP